MVVCGHGGHVYRPNLGGPGGECRLFEDPNLRMRNASQPGAVSDAARVHKHQVNTCLRGGDIYCADLRGPGGECRLLEVQFCENAMRGSPTPHPALLVSSCAKWTYSVRVDMSIVGILEGPGVDIVY